MKHILLDTIGFLKSLSTIDYLLYFAVLALIILTITMIYILKTSDEDELQEESGDLIDLKSIADNINENPKPLIDMTSYEEEQEEKAIISYDELLKRANNKEVNYIKEDDEDDILIKQVDIKHPIEVSKEMTKTPTVSLFNYEKEEAFLLALKRLSKQLN